jgi:hypothetical protein
MGKLACIAVVCHDPAAAVKSHCQAGSLSFVQIG